MKKNEILVTYGSNPKKMTKEILEASGLADMIPAGSRIGLKPNLVVAREASSGATTHTEIVAGAIEYLQEHGHSELLILEGSWVGDSTTRAWRVCGYDVISRQYNVNKRKFTHSSF